MLPLTTRLSAGSLSFFVGLKAKIEQPHGRVLSGWPPENLAWLGLAAVQRGGRRGVSGAERRPLGGAAERPTCLIRAPKRKTCLALNDKLCSHAGVTGSGFPFDFGRAPYKGKRPLKDMIGSYRNRRSSGDPSTEGMSGSGGAGKPEVQLQVQSLQEELEQLRKDLSSQKVPVPLLIPLPSPRDRQAGAWSQSWRSCFSESSFPEGPFPRNVLCSSVAMAAVLGPATLLHHLFRDI